MTAPTLHTDRLILRPTALEDFERWAELAADAEACRFIGGTQPRPLAWRGLMAMAGCWALTGVAFFSVIERASGRWVGRVGPWNPEGWPGPEVGWSLHRDAWGKGYATEAAAAAMDYAFDELGWDQVIHTIDPLNVGSQNVARRLGSVLIGPGRLPEPHHEANVQIWGQSRAQWQARVHRA